MRRLRTGAALVLLLGACLSGCREAEDRDVIALLLPDDAASRWEGADRPAFESAVAAACVGCVVEVRNAGGSAATQEEQLAEVKEDGADVVVLVAVDPAAGESLVQAAGATPVIAYDRFVSGADYFVSYDGSQVGTLQAEAILAAGGAEPAVLMLNGAVGDPGATELELAAREVLEAGGATVLAEENPVDPTADTAEAWVSDQLKTPAGDRVDAVYAAYDSQAEGVVAAYRAAEQELPVITGQDAELDALRRIVAGEQTMTVYKPVAEQADRTARIALDLLAGKEITGTDDHEGVPAVLFEPVAVTIENLTDTVVRDGSVSIEELCTADLLEACEAAGIA